MQVRKFSEDHYHFEYPSGEYFCCDYANTPWVCMKCSSSTSVILNTNTQICEKCWNKQQREDFNLMKMQILLEK